VNKSIGSIRKNFSSSLHLIYRAQCFESHSNRTTTDPIELVYLAAVFSKITQIIAWCESKTTGFGGMGGFLIARQPTLAAVSFFTAPYKNLKLILSEHITLLLQRVAHCIPQNFQQFMAS
jgi:hypothetical protein